MGILILNIFLLNLAFGSTESNTLGAVQVNPPEPGIFKLSCDYSTSSYQLRIEITQGIDSRGNPINGAGPTVATIIGKDEVHQRTLSKLKVFVLVESKLDKKTIAILQSSGAFGRDQDLVLQPIDPFPISTVKTFEDISAIHYFVRNISLQAKTSTSLQKGERLLFECKRDKIRAVMKSEPPPFGNPAVY